MTIYISRVFSVHLATLIASLTDFANVAQGAGGGGGFLPGQRGGITFLHY